MDRFTGHRVLVTGGASGIGEATARALRAEGAQVVIADINDTLGRQVADEIGGEYEHLDVRKSDQWANVVQRHHFTDGVLNAGAGARFDDLREVSDDTLETVLDTNLLGIMIGTRELFRSMADRGGAISVTSSIAGLVAHTQSPVYAASKWGTIGWVRSIATSLAQSGVIINAVCPGLVDTPILGPGGGDAMRKMGLKVLAASEVATAHLDSLLHTEPGTVFTVQAEVPVGIHESKSIAGYQG